MGKLKYNEDESTKWVSMSEGAKRAGCSYARFRKAIQRLGIRVQRVGWLVAVPIDAPARVKKALRDGTIRPGRKKKGTT